MLAAPTDRHCPAIAGSEMQFRGAEPDLSQEMVAIDCHVVGILAVTGRNGKKGSLEAREKHV